MSAEQSGRQLSSDYLAFLGDDGDIDQKVSIHGDSRIQVRRTTEQEQFGDNEPVRNCR